MARSSVLIDLDDPRTAKIADVISNKTCKKILQSLSEREMSESEISRELKIPINTVDYNIKKLYQAGLVEQSKKFLWSEKGKRIYKYRVSDKRIIISPKTIIKGVVHAFIASIIGALGIYYIFRTKGIVQDSEREAALYAASEASKIGDGTEIMAFYSNPWIWFLIGALLVIVLIVVLNKKR